MKHIQKFDRFRINEELTGLGILAGVGLAFAASAIYDKAKKFWSNHVIGDKYQETGKKEVIITKLPPLVSPTAILSDEERKSGEVKTEIKQYKDDFGNLYWGYDHLYSDEEYASWEEAVAAKDIYTALFKEEDYTTLKSFLQNSDRYSGKGVSASPTPVEMIFREDI